MRQVKILETVNVLPISPHPKQGQFPALNFSEELHLMGQDLRLDVENSFKLALADSIAFLVSKQPQNLIANQEHLQAINQQALDFKKEIESLKSQLCR